MASSSAAVGARAWIGFGEGGGGVELAGYALLSPPHFRLASRLVCCCLGMEPQPVDAPKTSPKCRSSFSQTVRER